MWNRIYLVLLAIVLAGCSGAPGTAGPQPSPIPSTPDPHLSPSFMYPVDGQTLDLGLAYLFRVTPVADAQGYRWDFYQNNVLVWENLRDEGGLSPSDYGLHPGSAGHSRFVKGYVRVEVRAKLADGWSDPAVITIYLRPLPATATADLTPTAIPSQTPRQPPIISPTGSPVPTPSPLPRLSPGQSLRLTSIKMMDDRIGWATLAQAHILRTTDAGSTWREVSPPWVSDWRFQYPSLDGLGSTIDYSLYSPATETYFFALDADHAWAIDRSDCSFSSGPYYCPKLFSWQTSDGGQSWQRGGLFPGKLFSPLSLRFSDSQHGMFSFVYEWDVHNSAWTQSLLTNDGGASWMPAGDPGIYCMPTDPVFLDNDTGWIGDYCANANKFLIGQPKHDFLTGKILPQLSATKNGGRTWEPVSLPAPTVIPTDLAAANADYWMFCTALKLEPIDREAFFMQWNCTPDSFSSPEPAPVAYLYLTTDLGRTWRSWVATGNESFLDGRTGWRMLVSDTGGLNQLQETIDGGQAWTTVQKVAWPKVSLDFVSGLVGWGIVTGPGDGYALVRTTDGGETWTNLKPVLGPAR